MYGQMVNTIKKPNNISKWFFGHLYGTSYISNRNESEQTKKKETLLIAVIVPSNEWRQEYGVEIGHGSTKYNGVRQAPKKCIR